MVVLAIYLALSFINPQDSKIPAPFLYQGLVFILQNFLLLPGMFPIKAIIAVAWSLSFEMSYYLFIPLIIWLSRMRSWEPKQRILTFLLLLWLLIVSGFGGISEYHIRLSLFISGIILYETDKHKLLSPPQAWISLLALIAGLVLMPVPIAFAGGGTIKTLVLFVCFFLLCFSCFCDRDAFLAKSFSWTPARWLGNMSYSYYLIHGLTLKIAFKLLGMVLIPAAYNSQSFFWLMMPVMFCISLIPATLLFLLVERPFSLTPKRAKSTAIQDVALAVASEEAKVDI